MAAVVVEKAAANKRFLLTGASGFIGQALYQRACPLGYEVIVLARRDPLDLSSLEGLDGVIHLAGESISLVDGKRKNSASYLAE